MRVKPAIIPPAIILPAIILASLVLAASGVSALARPAVTSYDAVIRTGPGPDHRLVAIIAAGEPIDVGNCISTWCRVSSDGGVGFMSRSKISYSGEIGAAARPPNWPYGSSYNDYNR